MVPLVAVLALAPVDPDAPMILSIACALRYEPDACWYRNEASESLMSELSYAAVPGWALDELLEEDCPFSASSRGSELELLAVEEPPFNAESKGSELEDALDEPPSNMDNSGSELEPLPSMLLKALTTEGLWLCPKSSAGLTAAASSAAS